MDINSESIKEYIKSRDIDLVGIAGADTLMLAKPPCPATKIMPSAKSVIIMGVAHSLGSVYGPMKVWTRNKMQTSRILNEVAEKVSRILEREGYLTTPISADKPAEIHLRDPDTGKKLKHVKTISHLSFKHAAQGIGMGEIGLNNLLLTPEFGPHQRLSGIITEAPLEPDPPKKIKMCDNCKKCEKACPVGALKDGEYNVDPCFDFWGTGLTKPMPRNFFEILKRTPYLLKHKKRRHLITEIMQIAITDVDFCIECMRACPKGSAWEKIRPKLEFPKKTSIF